MNEKATHAESSEDKEGTLPSSSSSAKKTSPQTSPVNKKGKGSSLFVALLFIVMGLGLATLSFFIFEQNKSIDALFSQQNEMNASRQEAGRNVDTLAALVTAIEEALDDTQEQLSQHNAELQQLSDQLINARLRAREASTETSSVYLLNEVEAMLRLAQQRLILGRDTKTAIALVLASDEVLRDIDDSSVFSARDALAVDLAALRAVPEIDVQGIYLSLSALSQRIAELELKNAMQQQLDSATEVAFSSQQDEPGFFAGLMEKLSNTVTIRRLDEPLQPMLSAEQGYYLRQNIRLLLEQAQLALWRNQQEIFQDNIEQAQSLVQQNFTASTEALSLLRSLEALQRESISTPLPPLNRGLNSVRLLLAAYDRGQAQNETINGQN